MSSDSPRSIGCSLALKRHRPLGWMMDQRSSRSGPPSMEESELDRLIEFTGRGGWQLARRVRAPAIPAGESHSRRRTLMLPTIDADLYRPRQNNISDENSLDSLAGACSQVATVSGYFRLISVHLQFLGTG